LPIIAAVWLAAQVLTNEMLWLQFFTYPGAAQQPNDSLWYRI